MRRRTRARSSSSDQPALVLVGNRYMTVEQYQSGGAIPNMKAVDAMPPAFRALVYEFNIDKVWGPYRNGVPAEALERRLRASQ